MFFRIVIVILALAVAVHGDDRSIILQRARQKALAVSAVKLADLSKALANWRTDGSFKDVNYDEVESGAWDGVRHWDHVRAMAWAWAEPKSPRRYNPELGERIYKSIIFWHRVRPCPLQNIRMRQVEVPKRAKDALLLAQPLLQESEEGRKAIVTPLQSASLKDAADIVFVCGLLEQDARRMKEAASAITSVLKIAEDAHDGIMSDGSFHKGGARNQLGTAGLARLNEALSFGWLVKGTGFELDRYQMNALRKLVLDGFAWVMWNGRMDLHAMGGVFDEKERVSSSKQVISIFRSLAEFDSDYRRGYQTVLMGNEPGGENAFVGARAYWQSDFVVVRQPKYYVSLQMTSKRTCPMENDMGAFSRRDRYFSDGSLLLMTTGDEYGNMASCWNWTRLPGTTLPDSPVQIQAAADGVLEVAFDLPPRWTGEREFTGAVSSGLHVSAIYSQDVDGVRALKAVFCAPGAIACLGTGITSESPHAVATTVEQRPLSGALSEGNKRIWHDGVAYLGENLRWKTEKMLKRADSPSAEHLGPHAEANDMLTIGIEHGVGCRGETYAYEIRPGTNREQFLNLEPEARIMSNTTTLQAVAFADGTICAVFHEAGKLGDFETDTPCVFILEKDRIYLAEPTQLAKQMKIGFKGRSYWLELPQGRQAGATVSIPIDGR